VPGISAAKMRLWADTTGMDCLIEDPETITSRKGNQVCSTFYGHSLSASNLHVAERPGVLSPSKKLS